MSNRLFIAQILSSRRLAQLSPRRTPCDIETTLSTLTVLQFVRLRLCVSVSVLRCASCGIPIRTIKTRRSHLPLKAIDTSRPICDAAARGKGG
ncbi:hypothetical protein RB213_008390, partial [Colletotrichum asianum]